MKSETWLADRRVLAVRLFQAGWAQRDIALELGVSRSTVSRWLRRWREKGTDALRELGTRYVPPLVLQGDDLLVLVDCVAVGPVAFGFADEQWTAERFWLMLAGVFGVTRQLD